MASSLADWMKPQVLTMMASACAGESYLVDILVYFLGSQA